MKILLLLVSLILFFVDLSYATTNEVGLSKTISNRLDSGIDISSDSDRALRMGLYIDNICNIDYQNQTYTVVCYIWNNTIGEFINLESDLDFLNYLEKDLLYDEKDSAFIEGVWYYSHMIKVKCVVLNDYDLRYFPFDNITLRLQMELLSHFSGEKDVLIDTTNSHLIPDFLKEWRVQNAEISLSQNSWNSNFGDFEEDSLTIGEDEFKTKGKNSLPLFDTLNAKISLKRDSWGIYFKLFFVLFLSLIMAASSVFLPNEKSEEKISIIVGGLFASIGNKYITDSIIPVMDSFGLSDRLHLITIFGLLVLVLYAIYEQRLRLNDSVKKEIAIFSSVILIYFGAVGLTTWGFVS